MIKSRDKRFSDRINPLNRYLDRNNRYTGDTDKKSTGVE